MTILIAPDKFKGSLSAIEVCKAIEKGVKKYDDSIETILHPLADGGEGSIEVLSRFIDVNQIRKIVKNPVGEVITATYFLDDNDNAYIELASASGLMLITQDEQNPMFTSTIGTGELIADAINKGVKHIYLFIGGSSTTDAGTGILVALGYRFLDSSGNDLFPSGENLIKIAKIDKSKLNFDLEKIKFTILCDVNNPLYGKNGAAYVYSKQKGASETEVKLLDSGLRNFSKIVKEQFGIDISDIEGGGAAGGVAAGLYGLLNADINSGIDEIMKITRFEENLKIADLVISGEGKLDYQSLQGKVINKISFLTKRYNTPLILLVGQNKLSQIVIQNIRTISIDSIANHALDLDEAIKKADFYLEKMAFEMINDFFSENLKR